MYRFIHSLLLFVAVWLFAGSVASASELDRALQPLIAKHAGQVGVVVKHLNTGESFSHRADEPMPTASLIKFPVMIEAYRQIAAGKLTTATLITLHKEDQVPGSGILTPHFSPGAQIPLRDAIRLMIAFSDNTATNLVLDQIGLKSTAETMRTLGCPNTQIHSKVFRRDTSIAQERSKEFGLGSTTAAEMISLLERLHNGELVSQDACEEMMSHLLACEDKEKLPRFLPSGTKIAHKTGSVTATRCDAGIIFAPDGPIAVCVLTDENKDRRWTSNNAGNRLCADVGRAVFRYFSRNASKSSTPADSQELRLGDGGELVEALQRTLNKRLTPSPELSIDGDFGPVTESAVTAFQKSQSLPTTGVVDEGTWKALGTLETEDAPVPAPEVVNSEQLPRKPSDALQGPPFLTCKAWVVGDYATGNVLWGNDESQPLDIASTTKIMTAYIGLKLAEEQPEILQETVRFSQRADETIGSTARVRAGETLPVSELLYGLLLPSGNDASVALAEHFGDRLEATYAGETSSQDDKTSDTQSDDPHDKFVRHMNRTAAELGMSETQFRNPHGLTEDGHKSSARDLLKLARAALKTPRFQDYVDTRQRGCTVTGPGGYRRNVVWKNTNRLLGIDGYQGVKTGTTSAAGACLVASGKRGDDRLLIVVLGSSSSAARYTDTRNLFRWAWNQRAASE